MPWQLVWQQTVRSISTANLTGKIISIRITRRTIRFQFVPGSRQRYDQYRISVIFTEEDETADSYIERAAAEMNTVQNLVEVATSDLNEQWAIFSQGALRVSARELEERVNTVKSDLDKMSAHIDLKTPKLRPWDDAQLGKLQDLLNEIE